MNQGKINAELEYEIIQLKKEKESLEEKLKKSGDKMYAMVAKMHALEAKSNT